MDLLDPLTGMRKPSHATFYYKRPVSSLALKRDPPRDRGYKGGSSMEQAKKSVNIMKAIK